ncbi:MAG: putative quinol monooxygenase [Burkholderiales bacterium]
MSAPQAVTVFARIRAAPGRGDALAALLAEQVGAVRRTEPGCLEYRVHRATEDPDLFAFYEIYADDAAFAAHRASPHLADFRRRREEGGLVQGPAQVEVYRAVAG